VREYGIKHSISGFRGTSSIDRNLKDAAIGGAPWQGDHRSNGLYWLTKLDEIIGAYQSDIFIREGASKAGVQLTRTHRAGGWTQRKFWQDQDGR